MAAFWISPKICTDGRQNRDPAHVFRTTRWTQVVAPERTRTPSNAIGLLVRTMSGGETSICTAALISHEHLLTAAHCVYGEVNGVPRLFRMENFCFYFNPEGGEQPQSQCGLTGSPGLRIQSLTRVGTPQPLQDRTRDWAILRLDNVNSSNITAPLIINTQQIAVGALGRFIGYGVNFQNGDVQHQSQCQVRGLDDDGVRLKTDCSFSKGASGGPWFFEDTDKIALIANEQKNPSVPPSPAQRRNQHILLENPGASDQSELFYTLPSYNANFASVFLPLQTLVESLRAHPILDVRIEN